MGAEQKAVMATALKNCQLIVDCKERVRLQNRFPPEIVLSNTWTTYPETQVMPDCSIWVPAPFHAFQVCNKAAGQEYYIFAISRGNGGYLWAKAPVVGICFLCT